MVVFCLLVDVLERANEIQKKMKYHVKEKKKLKGKDKEVPVSRNIPNGIC